ncbi:MAG: hypothetical protein JW889_13290 [Verrucomicrobia bacterium]|nr:hypothetical protein [Verrucomicrobiota bacterium]
MLRLTVGVLLSCSVLGAVAPARAAEPMPGGSEMSTVRSYGGQFVVTAPDVEYASVLARRCERITEAVGRRLGLRGQWDGRASVWVRTRTVEGPNGPETVWDAGVSRKDVTRAATGLWFGQVEEFLELAVTYHVLRDIAEVSAAANGGTLEGRPIPFWLTAGLAQLLDTEHRLELFRTTATAIEEKRSFLLKDLFEHDGESADARGAPDVEQRAIFLQQSATVVDFLLGSKRGAQRLLTSLQQLHRRSGFTFSLRWEYRDLYPTLDAMQAAWEQYVHERPLHVLSEGRFSLAQTEARLEEILRVTIPVIDPETIETSEVVTDFEGLSTHKNRPVAVRIANEKAEQVLQLTLRSASEFKPALEAYARALTAIRDGERGSFKRWYKRAGREHEAVRRLPYFTTGEAD